jgi:hypothetical protein
MAKSNMIFPKVVVREFISSITVFMLSQYEMVVIAYPIFVK